MSEWRKTYFYLEPVVFIVSRPIFTLNLLFLSKIDSTISAIGADAVFTIQFNDSGKAEIGMSLPDFAEEKLDI